jgi:selenide,water dikinase
LGITSSSLRLTQFSHGAGCGCKLPAPDVQRILSSLDHPSHPNLLVGLDTSDDAGVFRLRDDLALVQTVDFFTPIVDDPYDFGRIAAANALSDVYAMGGEPITALNLVALPLAQLGPEIVEQILRGGADVAAAAGTTIVGGHSIDDPEPKYGMAVTGTVHPERVLRNAGGRAGDALVLTKPLGVGVIATACKRGLAASTTLAAAVEVMTTLNGSASRAALSAGAHAATDVTGFGLLGHLHELARASGVAAEVDSRAVPAIADALALIADDRLLCGGSARNREHAELFTRWDAGVGEPARRLLCDAMTSGGLLVAVAPGRAPELPGPVIGRLVSGEAGRIRVVAG